MSKIKIKFHKFLCAWIAISFISFSAIFAQGPCGNSSPTTQPTNFQIANRNQNGFDITFSVDNAANAFAILRSTSSTPVNLSSLVNGTDITVGQTIDNATVIFLSQTRNAYNTPSLYNYGMRFENAWAGNQQLESFIYQESALNPNTEYYYTILSFNACDINTDTSPNNILPHHYQYNTSSPLTGSTATCLATPDRTQISVSNRTGNGFDLTVPKITGAASYSIFAYTDHGLSNALSGSPFNTTAFSTATGTLSASGIAANTILYYKVVANPTNANVCSSAPSHAAYSYRFAVPGDVNSQYIDNKVIIGCPAPTQTPTNLVTTMQQTGVENYISASFTGTSEASGYIVLHSTSNTPPTIPDGVSKPSIGGSSRNILVGGNYYWVTSNTSATSVSNKPLSATYNTTIYTWVIPYTLCADGSYKFYNSTPLTNTVVGCPSSPLTWSTTNATSTSFSVTFPFGGNNKVDVSTASDFSSFITNSPFSVTNSSANTISGLSPSTTYYARSYTVGSSCNSSYSSTKTISTLSPVVSSVSVTNGTYLYNSNIDIVVATNLSITPVRTGGVPSIDITIGSTVRQAVLVNTTASSSLTFRYTVQSSDVDANGISLGSTINLNGGTLKDAGGTNLNLALNSVASTTAVLVDGVPGPALTSLALVGSNAGSSLSISYTATFDNPVTGVTSGAFSTSFSGNISAATISSISGSGAVYTINVSLTSPAVTGSGTVYLSLKTNQTAIIDASGKSTMTTGGLTGSTYTYTPPTLTIPAPTISTTSYLSKYFVDASSDKVGINFPITLPAAGTLPSGTRYNASSWNDAQLEFSFDGTSWTALTTGANYQTIAGVAYKYVDNATARAYQLMIVPISPAAPTVYVRARTKVEDSVNGTFLYSDWTAANQLFSPPPPAVSSARLVLANGVYNVEVTMDKYDANQSVVSFERKQKVLGAANFSTVTIASSNSGFNSNGYGRGGPSGTVYTNYNWNYDLNLSTGNVYQFEVTPIFANSVRGTTYVFNQYLSNGTNSVTGTPLNHAIAVNVDLSNVLTQVSGATLVSTRYQFGLFTPPSTLSYSASTTIAGTNASTTLTSNSNGALVNGSTYKIFGTATLSASGVNFSVSLASVDVIPNPPALTITGLTGVNKEYDGNRTATTTGTAVLNGVANGHTVTLSGTPVSQFADAAIANGKAITVTGYTLSGANATDYTLVQPTGLTANITTKALTIIGITGTNKPYDGLLTATLTGTATLSGVVGSESVTLTSPSTFNFASAGVGNGIAISPTSNYSISGTDASHYTLTQPSSLSANITQQGLTISGLSAANKEYNGNTNVDVSGTATYVGLQNGESFSIAGSPSYAFADANVGNNKVINTSGFLAPSANYSISQPALTASITGKALSVTATGPIMTVGTALTTGLSSTNFTASGTISGEAVTSVTLTPNAAGLSASSPSGTSYTVTPSLATGSGGFLASNYIITYNAFTGVVAGPPVVSSINRVSAANTNQSTVNYTVTFDKAVTGVDVSDFQVTSTGATTATIASISGSAGTYTVVLNAISGDGTIRLDLKSSGTGIQDVEGRAIVSGYTSGQVYTVDQTAPTITGVTSSPSTGSKKAGDVIQVLVGFSENITVTGTPQITLETGTTDAQISYISGSGTNQLRFDYTVAAGNNSVDLDYTSTSALSINGGTILDAFGNVANLNLASPGSSNSLGANSSLVVDTQVPSGFDFTINQASVTVANQAGISITLSGAEVGTMATAQFTDGTTTVTSNPTITSSSQTISSVNLSSLADGTVSISVTLTDAAGNISTSVTKTIAKDALSPTVSSVTSSATNGSYKAGQTIPIVVNFTEAVTVSGGTPTLTLETGTTDAVVNYTSGSGTSALTFNYSVASGNTSSGLNYVGTNSLSLNGATIVDAGNNAATLSLPDPVSFLISSLAGASTFVIDTSVPSSYGFSFGQASITAVNKSNISISLSGAEVGTTYTAQFTDGTTTISSSATVSGATQTISGINLSSLADGTITGTLYLTDAAQNQGINVVQTLLKDAIIPTITNVSSSLSNGSYPVGQVIPVVVTFSEPVTVSSTPVITLETGATDAQVNYSSGSGTAALTFNYTVAAGQDVSDLDYTTSTSLQLNGGSISDAGANPASLILASPGLIGSLGYNKNITVDTQIPTVTGVSSSSQNGSYRAGITIPIVVSFTEPVTVTGTPNLTISVGGNVTAPYSSGSGTNALTFNYTIASGQTVSDLEYSSTNALGLNGGAIQDAAANNATLTLVSPGSIGSLGNSKNISVDTQTPTGYTLSNTANIDNTNKSNSGFTLSNAELGTTYTYTYSNGSTSVTGSGTVSTTTQVVTGIDVQTVLDGTVNLSVTLTDAAGNVGIPVTASMSKFTNIAPTGSPAPIVLNQNDPNQRINLLAGFTDAESDPISVSSVVISYSIKRISDNSNVTVTSSQLTKFADVVSPADLSNNELLVEMTKSTFLPGGQKGQINISYVITDGYNNVNASTTLTIIGANDQPSGNALTVNQVTVNGQNMGIPLTEGVGITTNVPGVDPDDDSVIYTLDQNSQVSNGSFVFNADGSFAFVPNANYFGEQQFYYYVKDASGIQNGPYLVKIVIAENPDIDGIPSKLEEIAPNNGDVNGDGVPDRKQNNITNLPLGSYADYLAGINWANGVQGAARPSTSRIGTLIAGSLSSASGGIGGNAVDLDPNAKFRSVAILPAPQIQNSDRQFATDLYQFTIEGLLSNANDTTSSRLPLRDLDPNRAGLQVRAILELPEGVVASTYLKQDAQGNWLSFKDDQNLATYDDGATLINLDSNPATIERIVLTFTDGAFGDNDRAVNASISDPGGLGTIYPIIADATLSSRAEGAATNTLLRNINDSNSNADVDGEGQTITYSLDPSNSASVLAAVQINSSTGEVTVKSADAFDFETFVNGQGIATMQIVVRATDSDGFYDTAIITQAITNVDEFPRIISGRTVSYLENQATSVPVITVQTLPDYQDATTFSILPGLDGASFAINPITGVLTFLQSPNYETKNQYTLDIQSIDLLGHTDHAVFTVYILDLDENSPARTTITSSVPMIYSDGTSSATITVTSYDASGIRVTDGGATVLINTTLGTISSVTDNQNGTYTATLTALNVYGRATLGFTINGNTGTSTTQVNIRSIYDNDGDSVTDSDEIADGTDPNDGCSFNPIHVVLAYTSTTWQALDCDGDGNPNGTDAGPLNFCEDGSGTVPAYGTAAYEIYRYADCDGDGILNGLECYDGQSCFDSDGDGIVDYLDPDADNDQIFDISEGTIDSDGDGLPNYKDIDSDNDGILDRFETNYDTDGDGIANYLDLDSDGDGKWDAEEAVNPYEPSYAADNGGVVHNPSGGFSDLNYNGLIDFLDAAKASNRLVPTDTDKDGRADFLDLDSDNDQILDAIESNQDHDGDRRADYRDSDSDGDLVGDLIESGADFDQDGIANYLDLDADGDGIIDRIEGPNACVTCADYVDNNDDGWDDRAQFAAAGWSVDTDKDKSPDFLDLDSDGDKILDSIELINDLDFDRIANFRDSDSDNDGLLDTIEAINFKKPVDSDGDLLADYEDVDADNDGMNDALEALDFTNPVDTDNDGLGDYRDVDSDQDGISDRIEAGSDFEKPLDSDADLIPDYRDSDADNDGIQDAVEAGMDPSHPKDSDGDGVADYRDTDSDNDGISDKIEVGIDPLNPLDSDKDGVYDFQDLDSDNDGLKDALEALNFLQPVDTDKDGIPDYRDVDADNDKIPDAVEAVNRVVPVDTDGDSTPDYRDLDSDGDKIPDTVEAGANPLKPVDTDGDGKADYVDLDSDNDSYLDELEAGSNPNQPLDSDKDGKADYIDVDSDNDGILDMNENDIQLGALMDCDHDGIDNRIDGDVCAVFAPQGISPNGDGKNDKLVIPGILRMQPNHLTILNRWGQPVYEVDNYKNDWSGEAPASRTTLLESDGRLPDGTYYYIIDFFEKYPTISTYLYIDRMKK
jgi:hypothetical protein